jgi:hypothetical protein
MAQRPGALGGRTCARAEGYRACTSAERREKARQGLGLGFKEKGRERETVAGAMAIDGRGGRRRLDVLQGEGG